MGDDNASDISTILQGMGSQAPDLGLSQPQTPILAPQQTQQQQAPRVPQPRPILLSLIENLVHPQAMAVAGQRPPSRADAIGEFLTDFLGAMGRGMSVSRGPGAGLRGFSAAVTQPYERSLQQFGMQQQADENQARIAGQQAQTQLTQAQLAGLPAEQQARLSAMTASPRFDPNTSQYLGNLNDAQFQAYLKGQGAARQNALSKQAQADLAANKGAKYVTMPDGGLLALDSKGNPLHTVQGAVDPRMLERYTTSQKAIPMGDGSIQFVPITSTSGVAGATTPQAQLQSKVPAIAQNQTPQSQLQQKVPALGAAAN